MNSLCRVSVAFMRYLRTAGVWAGVFTAQMFAATNSVGASTTTLVEFYSETLGLYVLQIRSDREGGELGKGWKSTGVAFTVAIDPPAKPGRVVSICRFEQMTSAASSPVSIVAVSDDCPVIAKKTEWILRSTEILPIYGPYVDCATTNMASCRRSCGSQRAVYLLSHPTLFGVDHRFVLDTATYQELTQQGWTDDGAKLCLIP